MGEYRTPRAGLVDRGETLTYRMNIGTGNTEVELWNVALVVCDPARGFSKEEAREILTAIGIVGDPEHTEMNWMGRKRGT